MTGQTRDANRSILALSRIACDLDEAVSQLEDAPSPGGERIYIDLPLLYLTRCVARLGRLVYGASS